MNLCTIVVIVLCSCVVPTNVFGQPDTLKGDPDDKSTSRRTANAEWFAGFSHATYNDNATTLQEQGVVYARLGYGGHIPLSTLGRLTTLWLVPAAVLGVGSSISATAEFPFAGVSIDFSVPVHVTIGYGALPNKSIAWGVEGGVGINVIRHFRQKAFTVAPSAMIDVSYTPGAVYRLRFMTDIIAADFRETAKYRTWSVSLVFGF